MSKSIDLNDQLTKKTILELPFQNPIMGGNPGHSVLLPVGGFNARYCRIYISGPVTGRADFNKPQFMEAETFLRTLGFWVWNPQHIPAPEHALSDEETWQWYMHFCVRAIPLCDSMLMLPDWQNSKGAVQEHRIAKMLGLEIYYSPVL